VEALLRWRREDGRLVSPAEFIPLAESSGLIVDLGNWVLRSACQVLQRLERAGAGNLRMSVNVSVMQFRQADFIDSLAQVMAQYAIGPQRLELEITESVAMPDGGAVMEQLRQLHALGVCVAIDDFGTGFSSLSYLEHLQVDRLKIDRSFVSQIGNSEGSLRIVETIIQLGRSLQLEVIAEGVEEQFQAQSLQRMGCHQAQGFLYAKPMELPALLDFLGIAE
jgi:EAL domain-containing protein (putative c-di-GMP-specific phosphodiesterase class I)